MPQQYKIWQGECKIGIRQGEDNADGFRGFFSSKWITNE